MQGRSIQEPQFRLLRLWDEFGIHAVNEQVVVAVIQHATDITVHGSASERAPPVSRHTEEAYLALFLQAPHRRQCLAENLIDVSKFDMVDLKQVHIVGFEPTQRLLEVSGQCPRRSRRLRLRTGRVSFPEQFLTAYSRGLDLTVLPPA